MAYLPGPGIQADWFTFLVKMIYSRPYSLYTAVDSFMNYQIIVCKMSGTINAYSNHDLRLYIDGLVQDKRNSIANALELRLSCTNPSIWLRVLKQPFLCSVDMSICVSVFLCVQYP